VAQIAQKLREDGHGSGVERDGHKTIPYKWLISTVDF